MFQMGMKGTKWEIFCSALELFAKSGYHNVSVKQVAGAAGIQPAAIYNHFAGKDDLLDTMYSFHEHYHRNPSRTFEEMLAYSKIHTVRETLNYVLVAYNPKLQIFMDRILAVALTLPDDPRTEALIERIFEDSPRRSLEPLLNHLIEQGRIEPLDIEAFLNGVICISYRMAVVNIKRKAPDTTGLYQRTMAFIFDGVREIEAPRPDLGV